MNQHTVAPWPQRFWSRVAPGQNGCLEWTAAIDRDGYGRICVDRTKAEGKPAPMHAPRFSCPKCSAAPVHVKCWACGWRQP